MTRDEAISLAARCAMRGVVEVSEGDHLAFTVEVGMHSNIAAESLREVAALEAMGVPEDILADRRRQATAHVLYVATAALMALGALPFIDGIKASEVSDPELVQ